MGRQHAKQTPEERKESKKKSSSATASSVKKKPDTGSWPCKMDGCKKVFAREADLKRHQRTTKTHSIPGFQCPQCDATFTRTDALRRHQKSRHNGVVIEPEEQDKGKLSGDGASSGSRSPSPGGSPSRSQGEGSANGSPPAAQSSSNAGSSGGAASYYRPHTMQDGYYAGYPPLPRHPPPGMMIDPHYPPPPIGLPTSATRGNWHPVSAAPPWGPDGHPMPPPPPGMYIPSYYPSPYYRHPGMPMPPHMPPQINPELLAQSNGVGPPESALRNTSADTPRDTDKDKDAMMADTGASAHSSAAGRNPVGHPEPPSQDQMQAQDEADARANGVEGPDASTLMAAAALQAVLAFQKEQEAREAQAASQKSPTQADASIQPPQQSNGLTTADALSEAPASADTTTTDAPQPQNVNIALPAKAGPSVVPVQATDDDGADLDAVGEPDQEVLVDDIVRSDSAESSMAPQPMDQLVTEDGTPMLNPAELLTQESLASPPPS